MMGRTTPDAGQAQDDLRSHPLHGSSEHATYASWHFAQSVTIALVGTSALGYRKAPPTDITDRCLGGIGGWSRQ